MARLALILAVLAIGCSIETDVLEREGQPDLTVVDADDEVMNRAIRDARESVQDFIDELPTLRERGVYFSVKVPIEGSAAFEHIWLDDAEFRDGAFHGRLSNEPLSEEYSLGDLVSAQPAEISDWMAVIDGNLYGGFTVVVVRSRKSEQQQEEFDQSLSYRVPESPQRF